MITIRRSKGRHHDRRREHEIWLTFHPQDPADPLARGFGTIELFDEDRLPPGAGVPPCPPHAGETVTYVDEGALAYEDSLGRAGVIHTGEFQRMSGGTGHGERNASLTDWAHVFRIRLRPSQSGRAPALDYEQKLFTVAERSGRLCMIASPDARQGSLRIEQDALMQSALLDAGQHVVHELLPGRMAWLHVVRGRVTVGDSVLTTGDGAGFTAERAVSLTAREDTSIFLLEVAAEQPQPPARLPASRKAKSDAAAGLSPAVLFRMLWDALVDMLGPAATATIVGRAARRALLRSPELVDLAVTRVGSEYSYVLPPSFERAQGSLDSLRALFNEIEPLLVSLTGQVVLRRLDRVPALCEWRTLSSS